MNNNFEDPGISKRISDWIKNRPPGEPGNLDWFEWKIIFQGSFVLFFIFYILWNAPIKPQFDISGIIGTIAVIGVLVLLILNKLLKIKKYPTKYNKQNFVIILIGIVLIALFFLFVKV